MHHPEVQEYHHTLFDNTDSVSDLSPNKTFLELTIRNEGFKPQPHSLDDIIHFQDLLEVPSTR